MRRSLRTTALTSALGLLLLLVGFGAGWISALALGGRFPLGADLLAFIGPGVGANASTPAQLRRDFSVFWEVWNLVEREFYTTRPLDRTRMIQGAIKGMLQSLDDQYTVYQEPELARQTNEHMQGKMGGIGTYLRITDGRAFLWKPIKGAPAAAAGLVQDDELVEVDGVAIGPLIAGLESNEAAVKVASLLRGEPGTPVALVIRRAADGTLLRITLTRADVTVISVESQMLDGGIGYIKISEFKANTTGEFDAAVRDLRARGLRGLVLDLRNNPGGFLQNAQDVLGRFYSGVALVEERRGGVRETINTNPAPLNARVPDVPLVVLVNGGTASASEIVAGALREKWPATYLLGEKTFGKGSVQYIHPLSDGGSARITIAHWFTPNRTAINKVGITPQFVVPYSEDARYPVPCVGGRQPAAGQSACGDSQLAWALRLLTTGETPPPGMSAAK
jgi:carboxyl-terminal processing protease